jgi:hypothetical protein
MIQLLVKAVHPLLGRITVLILWSVSPTGKAVAGAGARNTGSCYQYYGHESPPAPVPYCTAGD